MQQDFFPEPNASDETWAYDGESMASWLARSTLPRATEVRAFLNRNIACLPRDVRHDFCHALTTRWSSALFELVVARTLQKMGATVTVEQEGIDGHRPDFQADFEGQAVVVEATAPEFDRKSAREEKMHKDLLPIIDRRIPSGWSVLLKSVPLIDSSDSKAPLKKALDDFFMVPLTSNDNNREVSIATQQGLLQFWLLLGNYGDGDSSIAGGPVYTSWSDSKQRIQNALKQKRRQLREQHMPVLLAVNASGISSKFDDFDSALFGDSVTTLDKDLRQGETYFDASGSFARNGDRSTYAGLLAFIDVSPFGCKGPVLYRHPNAMNIPSNFEMCEERVLGEAGVTVKSGQTPRFIDEIGWAKL